MDEATLQKTLGAAIRSRREAAGMSQESFADHIGMHRAYYSAIERGERNLTLQTLARVASGLELKLAAVMKLAGL
jgi:transcriptional regulator with XRE-family HTH domain